MSPAESAPSRPEGAAPEPGRAGAWSRQARGRTAVLLCVAVLVFLGHAWLFRAYVNDDAYITFRYSRFLAEGRGPYFNVGEHVEGYTNFALMVLVAGVIRLFGPGAAAPFAKGLGVVSSAGALVVAFVLARRLARRAGLPDPVGLAGLAAGLLAVLPTFSLNSTSGLETGLYSLWLAVAVVLGDSQRVEGRWRGAGAVFAAAYLTRPEGGAVFAAHWLAQAVAAGSGSPAGTVGPSAAPGRRQARMLLIDGLVFTGVFAAHMAFRHAVYDGEWLPNTYYAKLGGFPGMTPWDYFRWGALHPFFGAAGAALALAGLLAHRGARHAFGPLAATAAFAVAEPFWAGSDWMLGWRLIAPYLPLAAVVVAAGWGAVWLAAAARVPALRPAWLLALVPLGWVYQTQAREFLHSEVTIRAYGYETGHRKLARWLEDGAARPGDAIALMDIGQIGYACPDLHILDVTGLTDRYVARRPGGFLRKEYDPEYVFAQRPRYIVVVLYTAGRSYERPTENLKLVPWSSPERLLMESAEFDRSYVQRRTPPGRGDWLEDLAAQIGAVRVFEHAHPGLRYLLTVFERRDG